MQIIYLHPHFTSPGGAGRMVLETGTRLARRGHDVHCICIRADRRLIGEAGNEIKFHEIGGPLSSSIWFWIRFQSRCNRVAETLRTIQATASSTVLFPQIFPANWWGAYVVRRKSNLKCIWYCQEPSAFIHSTDWKRSLPPPKNWIAHVLSPLLGAIDRKLCRRFNRVLVNSEFSKQYVQQVYGFGEEECRVVFLGVDHQRFRIALSESRMKRVTTIAKLTRFKNVDTIIKAIAELVGRGMSDVRLQIVGTGDAEPFLKQMVQKYALSDNVEFLGRLNDDQIVTLLQQSKVFCLASVDEPFGLVVVEALACGTPVVAINSGGPKEILEHRRCGQLVQPRNQFEVADALQHFLLANEVTFGEATQSAVERAADFQWDKTVDQLEQEFSNIAMLSAGTTNDENT